MTTKTEKIREQIAALEAKLQAAKEADEQAAIDRISKAAKRSGLLDIKVSNADLKRYFEAIVQQEKQKKNGGHNTHQVDQNHV